MAAHEDGNDGFHLQMAMDWIASMEEHQKLSTSGQLVTFKVDGFKKRKGSKDAFFSPPFYTNPGGYRLAIKVFADGYGEGCSTDVAVFAFVLKGKGYKMALHWDCCCYAFEPVSGQEPPHWPDKLHTYWQSISWKQLGL